MHYGHARHQVLAKFRTGPSHLGEDVIDSIDQLVSDYVRRPTQCYSGGPRWS